MNRLILTAAALCVSVSALGQEIHGLTTRFLYRGWHGSQSFISTSAEEAFDTRTTPMLDCAWGRDKKVQDIWPKLKNESFLTIRWVGSIEIPKAGNYTFRFGAGSGGRLMIDGKMLVDGFYGRGWKYYDATVELTAGKKEILVEMWTWAEGAVRLLWKEPGKTDFAIVPQGAFSPVAAKEVAANVASPKISHKADFAGGRGYAVLTPADGTYVRYTLDGSEPSRLHGALYVAPVAITRNCTLKTRSFWPAGGQSPVVEQAFKVKDQTLRHGLRIVRTGNSLTANAAVYWPLLEEAGGIKTNPKPVYVSSAGAMTKYLWETYATDKVSSSDSDARKLTKDNAPFDALITQPFWASGVDEAGIVEELEYTQKFYDLVLANSPKADLWVYAQWTQWFMPGELQNPPETNSTTAKQWRENMTKFISSCEQLRERLQAKYPNRKVRIIPCASALLVLQQAIVDGRIPGMKSYELEIMADSIHLGNKGCYFVSLVHYACLYGKSPVGLVVGDTDLTIEQQTKMQEIAWDVVKNYKWAGVTGK